MVIGNGLMAKTFEAYKTNPNVVIFASGVSNSTTTDPQEFKREQQLLEETLRKYPTQLLVYFSTCSITDKSVNANPYVLHKLAMETFLETNAQQYLICRVSNVVGPTGNPNTIVPFLVDAIQKNTQIQLWKYAERNLIDCEDVAIIVSQLLEQGTTNTIVNIANPEHITIPALVALIESHLDTKGTYEWIEKGNPLHIDTAAINEMWEKTVLQKGAGISYIKQLLNKYYR